MITNSSDDTADPDMDKTIYCLCGTTYDPNIFMIQCDICKDWFHGSCCNFQEYTAIDVERFHCPKCRVTCGPSVFKAYGNLHRYDYWDKNAASKAVQTGTTMFIDELNARHFRSDNEIVTHMSGHQLTEEFLLANGFDNPIVIDNVEGLGMTVPPNNFSLYDIEGFIGGNTNIDVIDVSRQTDVKMKLRDFVVYYNNVYKHKIFNVISLEISKFPLGRLVEAPAIARKLDWANSMWPKDYEVPVPQVQKYCLMSVKNSYTDFHIDFGGTSVWYHVLYGEKIFYFIKPSAANLMLYQQWMISTNQSEMFFGDQVDYCYKCTLYAGQTMIIPTGWIHAVYTSRDALVFGGNFLHSLNIPMQLQIYDIERQINTIEKFRFPYFECMHWFVAQNMYNTVKRLNSEEVRCPDSLLKGLKDIVASLKRWINSKYHCYHGKIEIPVGLNHTKLLKDIGKEIRHALRFIHIIEPPKPERESKRTRKRPFNKDFVDFSLWMKSHDAYVSQLKTVRSPKSPKTPKSAKSPKSAKQPKQPKQPKIPPLKLTLPKPSTYPYKSQSKKRVVELPPKDVQKPSEEGRKRPEETTAIHRGGAVLQFRLGTKDYFARTQSNEVSSTSTQSVYDFHDDSELEEPSLKTTLKKAKKLSKKRNSLKHKDTIEEWFVSDGPIEKEDSNNMDAQFSDNYESLTTVQEGLTDDETEISDLFSSIDLESLSIILDDTALSSMSFPDIPVDHLEDESISDVHQDDEYIYPSLDNSDDEDVQIFKPRGRSRVDEPWCPKAKLGPLLPKMNRPTREGTKKQAVEKVLEAAAAKRATETVEKSPKRQYRKRKPKPKAKAQKKKSSQPSTSASASINVGSGPSTSSGHGASTSAGRGASTSASTGTITSASTSSATSTTPVAVVQKQRKGMKTVKQRLGKILKLHKIMH